MAQNTKSPASFGEIVLLQKGEKQKLFHCQNGARIPNKQFNVEVSNMLPTNGARHSPSYIFCGIASAPKK